jgi:hypothetical protein
MRRSLWMLAIALGLIAVWSIGRLQAQGDNVTFADPNHEIRAWMGCWLAYPHSRCMDRRHKGCLSLQGRSWREARRTRRLSPRPRRA